MYPPPHVLTEIAKNGSPEQRHAALNVLDVDATLRTNRLTFNFLGGPLGRQVITGLVPQKQRTIYDSGHTQILPGKAVRSEGEAPVGDPSADEAYDGLGDTFDFYLNAYQRNSIDNNGSPLDASVHFGNRYDNAFWNGQQMIFGDGDSVIFNGFTVLWMSLGTN